MAYFERPGTSSGAPEAIDGRIEHLRGPALGVRSLINDNARSLPETSGSRPDYTLKCEEPVIDEYWSGATRHGDAHSSCPNSAAQPRAD